MNKRPIIGLSIAALVLSVIIGIAALPDEVLIEPSTIDNSQSLSEDVKFVPFEDRVQDPIQEDISKKDTNNIDSELDALKKEFVQLKKELNQIKTQSENTEDLSEISEKQFEETQDYTEGRVISINLNDGVGGGDK